MNKLSSCFKICSPIVCISLMMAPLMSLSKDQPILVSMVNLISEPDRYVDQKLAVIGYFGKYVNMHLFLTEDHATVSDTFSSILVSDTDDGDLYRSKCLMTYMEITGKFVKVEPNSYGIVDVERVYDPLKGEVCWERASE